MAAIVPHNPLRMCWGMRAPRLEHLAEATKDRPEVSPGQPPEFRYSKKDACEYRESRQFNNLGETYMPDALLPNGRAIIAGGCCLIDKRTYDRCARARTTIATASNAISWAATKDGTAAQLIPAKLAVMARASVTAGLAKLVLAVNQYAAVM